jgi:acetyltransferase-like isoleucine patch superfamily enzyme
MRSLIRRVFYGIVNRVLNGARQHILVQQSNRLGAVGNGTSISAEIILKGYLQNIKIGDGVRVVGAVTIDCDTESASIVIGDNTVLYGPSQLLTYGGRIELGKRCSVNPFCILYGHGGLTIGDHVRIATQTVIIPANHIFSDVNKPITEQGLTKSGIKIGNDVWIGAGVRILDGSEIGSGSVVGASTLVNGKFDPHSIIVGIPGKKIKSRSIEY